jgi:hypothetical protein
MTFFSIRHKQKEFNMSKFKLILFTAYMMLAVQTVFAQEETPKEEPKKVDTAAIMKIKYNVRGGLNFSSMTMRYSSFGRSQWTIASSGRQNFKSVLGFHAGGMADIPLALIDIANDAYLVSVHPGMQFIKKGGKKDFLMSVGSSSYFRANYTVDAYYIEMPVLFSFKKTFSESFAARADLGPYIAVGLFGTQELVGTSYDYDENESSFSSEGLERLDIGMYYGVTADIAKRFSVGFHVGTGFTDNSTQSLYATVGYRL